MNIKLKKLGVLGALVGLTCTGLTACGAGDSLPTVTGGFGEAPKISQGQGKAPEELKVKTLVEGKGEACGANSILNVHYLGQLWDGKEFDGNFGKPAATFPLSGVVKGWQEGLKDAKPGSRTLLVIPPDMGYGDQAQGDRIPANSTLVFVVDIDSCVSESTLKKDQEALKQAKPTGESISGVTVSGELGALPQIAVNKDALPAESTHITFAKGEGEPVGKDDRMIYQIAVHDVAGDETNSSYQHGEAPLITPVPVGEMPPVSFVEGIPVGSRVVTYVNDPTQKMNLVAVIDIVGVIKQNQEEQK